MERYAKIVNEDRGLVEVGLGENEAFYAGLGMKKRDVEQAWDGRWYLAGHCPEKPKENILNEELIKQQDYLSSTDWYAIRYADSGVEIPAEIKAKRQAARERIDEIRAEIEATTEEISSTGKETLQVKETEKVDEVEPKEYNSFSDTEK